MKLINHDAEQVSIVIRTLIQFNKIFGDVKSFTNLCYSINECENVFELNFYIDYYEDQNNQNIWQTITILKDDTFRKLVKEIQDVIYQFNDIQGYEDEDDYNFINNDKSEW